MPSGGAPQAEGKGEQLTLEMAWRDLEFSVVCHSWVREFRFNSKGSGESFKHQRTMIIADFQNDLPGSHVAGGAWG